MVADCSGPALSAVPSCWWAAVRGENIGCVSFKGSYAAAAALWPEGTESRHVSTIWGDTHVFCTGTPGGPTFLMLSGDGATATAWANMARLLAGRYRLLAPEPPGSPGLSTVNRAFGTSADMVEWLRELLDQLMAPTVHIVAHSAGAHLALEFALAHTQRVTALTLLDPTLCFAGHSPRYLLRALPMLVRPTAVRVRRFIDWEVGARTPERIWLQAFIAGATDFDRTPIVRTKRPSARQLAGLTVPTLVVVADRSRAHNPQRVARRATQLSCVTATHITDATHHTMPVLDAELLAELVARQDGPG